MLWDEKTQSTEVTTWGDWLIEIVQGTAICGDPEASELESEPSKAVRDMRSFYTLTRCVDLNTQGETRIHPSEKLERSACVDLEPVRVLKYLCIDDGDAKTEKKEK